LRGTPVGKKRGRTAKQREPNRRRAQNKGPGGKQDKKSVDKHWRGKAYRGKPELKSSLELLGSETKNIPRQVPITQRETVGPPTKKKQQLATAHFTSSQGPRAIQDYITKNTTTKPALSVKRTQKRKQSGGNQPQTNEKKGVAQGGDNTEAKE